MRRLRLRHRQIGIAIVFAVISTLATAWAMAFYATVGHASVVAGGVRTNEYKAHFAVGTTTFLTKVTWFTHWPIGNDGTSTADAIHGDMLPYWSRASIPADSEPRWTFTKGDTRSVVAYGWPARSMCAMFNSHVVKLPWGGEQVRCLTDCGIALETLRVRDPHGFVVQPRALPLRVIPLGFVINSALFAAIWWLLLFAVPTMRRYLRVRRGTCLKCGYGPLASPDAVCPECGRVRGEKNTRASAAASTTP